MEERVVWSERRHKMSALRELTRIEKILVYKTIDLVCRHEDGSRGHGEQCLKFNMYWSRIKDVWEEDAAGVVERTMDSCKEVESCK